MPDRQTGGYRYNVTDEQIRRYLKVPVERRLRWLEEGNRLRHEALKGERLRAWQAFRDGKIG